ncbi:hypothetical protein A2Y83_03540 [Candidatus Falkowbacteria bacterium RBG_13_39_14]|uniref:AB hydrolase-1 domain-containing protein n=1 Tax=Candidatus Falkowbacteria bacterium RBG_13_39_14 TaxID=1797985 RepID=A0A1F5S6A1_9BACT|nr:MAG: hypothetical protein A2Y83_03540 [Candidatus Falkowbacteria bacterium RBG_13_39_14]
MFEPKSAEGVQLPLIMFNHGWYFGKHPNTYRAWIEHMVKRGNIVVFPAFQENARTSPSLFTLNALGALRKAIARLLNEEGHAMPDLNKFATIGHSAGGIIAANIAAMASRENIPRPKAVMAINPGNSWAGHPLEDMSDVPRGTLLAVMAAEKDNLAFMYDAKRIFYEATEVLPEDKNLIIIPTDKKGTPDLTANHFAPCGVKTEAGFTRGFDVNGLDYYGYWKIFDGLTDAAFYNKNRRYALGNTPEQRYMGTWSDGEPIKELIVITDPNPKNFSAYHK